MFGGCSWLVGLSHLFFHVPCLSPVGECPLAVVGYFHSDHLNGYRVAVKIA